MKNLGKTTAGEKKSARVAEKAGAAAKDPGKKSAKERRAIIKARLDSGAGELRLSALANEFHVDVPLLYKDRDAFYDQQVPIGIRAGAFVQDEESLRLVRRRSREHSSAKDWIGQLGATLIVSPKPKKSGSSSLPAAEDAADGPLFSLVQDQLPPDMKSLPAILSMKLNALDRRAHRLAILDSGSTTLRIAAHLVKVKTPDPNRHLSALRVMTNGKEIADELNDPKNKCQHEVILLGGVLRSETQAVAGHLAERCLDSWGIGDSATGFADIAIVGTTGVGIGNESFECYCDHESEQIIKSRLLGAARIRCIAADSHKLLESVSGKHSFTALAPQFVDIVLTDEGILKPKDQSDKYRESKDANRRVSGPDIRESNRHRFLDHAAKIGLTVVVARAS